MKRSMIAIILMALIFTVAPQISFAAKQTVVTPLTLDYPFIRGVLVDQLYTQPGERAIVVDRRTNADCAYIEMWNPEVRSDGSFITIGSNIKVQGGIPILGNCKMLNWEGYIELTQKVHLDENPYQLRLETVDSHVYKTNRQPIAIATTFWDLIKTYVHPYFSKMTINLAFPVDEVKTVLPLFFTEEDRQRVETWMQSLKLEQLRVEEDAIRLDLSMTVETNPPAEKEPAAEISPEEIDRISKLWQTWDAYLVSQMESLLGETLTDQERQSLFETLIETRYGFIQALKDNSLGKDLVREQFVWTWQQLASILRTHLVKKAGHGDLIKYLAFFTASDALSTLDKLGPTMNLDISREGLIQLVQLLGDQQAALGYSTEVDLNLRYLLGFGPLLDDAGPSYEEMEIPLPSDEPANPSTEALSKLMRYLLITSAYAAEPPSKNLEELKQWIVPEDDLKPYLERVKQVLEKTSDEAFAKSGLDPSYQALYRLMVMSTAWQESCWRQILKSKGNLQPLFSYTQSSVGLMQVNERVWRGMYKIESLRWNIDYNARAGAEILSYYLKDFALKKMNPANPLDQDTLCCTVYAMYNGGPGQFKEFLKRKKANSCFESDKLFWDKYSMAKAGDFDKVSICLTGK